MAMAFVTQEELRARLEYGCDMLILDSRSPVDYDRSSLKIRGAVRLAPDEAQSLSHQLPRDREIIVYACWDGEWIGPETARLLRTLGIEKAYPLLGGFESWLRAGFEMEPK